MSAANRASDVTDLQNYLLQVEERQRQMEADSMALLSEFDKMDHQTEIMAIQVEKLQILRDQCYHILKQQQLGAVTQNRSGPVGQMADTNLRTYTTKSNYLGELNLERNADVGFETNSYLTSLPDSSFKYIENPRSAASFSFLSQENRTYPNIPNINSGIAGQEYANSSQQFSSLLLSESLDSSNKVKLSELNSGDSEKLLLKSQTHETNLEETRPLQSKPCMNSKQAGANQFLADTLVGTVNSQTDLEETRLLQSTPCMDSKQASSNQFLANTSISTVNSHNMEELTFRTADSNDVSTEPLMEPSVSKDNTGESEEIDMYEQVDAGGENDMFITMNDEEIDEFVAEAENIVSEDEKGNSSLQIQSKIDLSTEEDKSSVIQVEVNTELDGEISTGNAKKRVEFQEETEVLEENTYKQETEVKMAELSTEDEAQSSEQQQTDSPTHEQYLSPSNSKAGTYQPTSLHTRNPILSDSEISDNNDIPLTSSAAYQSLIGAAPIPQQQQKLPVTSEESESEDDVERAMAMAVKSSGPELKKAPSTERKEQALTTSESTLLTKTNADQPRKSISSSSNYKHKISKATRKVLGLDSESDEDIQKNTQKSTMEDDDEFDFFD